VYSLDINFLNDRPEYKSDAPSKRQKAAAPVRNDSKAPYVFGALAMVLLPAIAGGLWFYLQSRNAELEQESAALDAKLGQLQDVQKKIASINAETTQVKNEAAALATVFNQIKPWSAMMQDIRTRIPPGVQITLVKQLPVGQGGAPPPPSPAPSPGATPTPGAAPPVPTGLVQISGIATSFNDVNDFMLVLQKSSFVKANETKLVTSELKDSSPLVNLGLQNVPQVTVDTKSLPPLPKQVVFQIQTALSDIPASELMRELELKGAAGLVARIEALKQKGVIQP